MASGTGQRLGEFMAEHGISVEAVAAELGFTTAQVWAQTTGMAPVAVELVDAVAELAGHDTRSVILRVTGLEPAPEAP